MCLFHSTCRFLSEDSPSCLTEQVFGKEQVEKVAGGDMIVSLGVFEAEDKTDDNVGYLQF